MQQWNDQSGQVNNATEASAGRRPIYTTNVLNGKPILRFDGSDDRLLFTAPLTGTTQTHFVVVKNTDTTASIVIGDGSGGGSSRYIVAYGTAATNDMQFNRDSSPIPASPAGLGTAFNILSAIQNGANATCYLNGTAGTPQVGGMGSGALVSMGDYVTAIYRMEGDIAEYIYYDTALNNTDRVAVEAYLNAKYAIY